MCDINLFHFNCTYIKDRIPHYLGREAEPFLILCLFPWDDIACGLPLSP